MSTMTVRKICLVVIAALSIGCTTARVGANKHVDQYVWNEVAPNAAYPVGYNYPVFVVNDEMWSLNKGGWRSVDGANWSKTALPESGLNSAYQKYVQFKGAIYALGTMEGDYLSMKLTSCIARTTDLKTWEVVAQRSNLPARVFYGAMAFNDKIWLLGGWDGHRYYNDVWSSLDGVKWERAIEHAPWTPRNLSDRAIAFQGKLWIFGGGVIDGEPDPVRGSDQEVWNSTDGLNWTKVQVPSPRKLNGTLAVFDDRLWLAGANRGNAFESGMLYSDDGVSWQELKAPWSPRGGVAVWVLGNKLYLTGGKSSHNDNGEIKFVYSNDVWAMSRRPEI